MHVLKFRKTGKFYVKSWRGLLGIYLCVDAIYSIFNIDSKKIKIKIDKCSFEGAKEICYDKCNGTIIVNRKGYGLPNKAQKWLEEHNYNNNTFYVRVTKEKYLIEKIRDFISNLFKQKSD